MWLLILRRVTIDFFLDFFYFPIWWYSAGAMQTFRFCIHLVKISNSRLAPGLWLKNIFVPMYGQYDWQGRIMSFFMRCMNVVFRSAALLIWAVFCAVFFILWFLFPIFAARMLLYSIV